MTFFGLLRRNERGRSLMKVSSIIYPRCMYQRAHSLAKLVGKPIEKKGVFSRVRRIYIYSRRVPGYIPEYDLNNGVLVPGYSRVYTLL